MKFNLKALALAAAVMAACDVSAQQPEQNFSLPASFSMLQGTDANSFSPSSGEDFMKKRRKKRGRDQAFGQGKSVITVGYGFPSLIKSAFRAYESNLDYKVSGFGPAHLKYEYGVTDKIGLGLSIRYLTYKVQWSDEGTVTTYDTLGNPTGTTPVTYTSGYKGSSLGIMARMNFHFATGDKFDPYWGFGIGYGSYNFDYFTDDPDGGELSFKFPIPLAFESTVGCRYFFTDNIGAYAELGWGGSYLQAGLAAKF